MKSLLLCLLILPLLLRGAEELVLLDYQGYRNFHLRIAREVERELIAKYPDLKDPHLADRFFSLSSKQAFGSTSRNIESEKIEKYLSWNPDQSEDDISLRLVASLEAIGIGFSAVEGSRLEFSTLQDLKVLNSEKNIESIKDLFLSDEYPTIEYVIINEKWHRVWHGAIRKCYNDYTLSCYPFLETAEFKDDFYFSFDEGPSIYKPLPRGVNPFSKRTPNHYTDYLLRYLESNGDQTDRTELLKQILILKDMGIEFEYGTKARYEPKLEKVIMTNTKQAHSRFSHLFRNYLKPVKAEPAGIVNDGAAPHRD